MFSMRRPFFSAPSIFFFGSVLARRLVFFGQARKQEREEEQNGQQTAHGTGKGHRDRKGIYGTQRPKRPAAGPKRPKTTFTSASRAPGANFKLYAPNGSHSRQNSSTGHWGPLGAQTGPQIPQLSLTFRPLPPHPPQRKPKTKTMGDGGCLGVVAANVACGCGCGVVAVAVVLWLGCLVAVCAWVPAWVPAPWL